MRKAVFCLTNDLDHADRIVRRLQGQGFREEDISILFSDREGKLRNKDGHPVAENIGSRHQGTLGTENTTKAPEGAATGATIGGIIGGTLGLLVGIGSLAIPGMGAFIAAGPLLAALSGSGIGGALGLIVGTLVGLGLPEFEAKKYENALEKGHVLLCVHTFDNDKAEAAKKVLSQEDAHSITTSCEKAGCKH